MTKKAVTIRDVARRAGVSVATASRALNGSQVVNAQTRDRILSVMEELGFTPSPAARRLSLGRTLTIGVVVSFLTRPQAAERLRGVDAVLTDSEFDLVIYNVESVQKRDHYLGTLVHSQRTDGLLVMSLPPPPEALPALSPRPGARSCSSTSTRRRSRPCRASSATTWPAARSPRGHLLALGHTARSRSSVTRWRIPSGSPRAGIARKASSTELAGRRASSIPPGMDRPRRTWPVRGARARPPDADRRTTPDGRSSPQATRRLSASSPRRVRSASTSPTICRSSATTTSRPPITSA